MREGETLCTPPRKMTGWRTRPPIVQVCCISLLSPELAGKRLQLLREIAPSAARVAVLRHRVHAGEEQEWKANEAAAKSVNLTLQFLFVPEGDDFAKVFAAIKT
jgi:putative ABC transport system substrate-binding protein